MASCIEVKHDDINAYRICRRAKLHDSSVKFDGSYAHQLFDPDNSEANPRLVNIPKNGTFEPAEIYASAIGKAETEENANAMRLLACIRSSSCDPKKFKFKSRFHKFMTYTADTRVPWLFDDFNSFTDLDKSTFAKIIKSIDNAKASLSRIPNKESNPTKYHSQMTYWLMGFIIRPQRRGGLEIMEDKKKYRPERNVVEIIRDGNANCVEFVKLFLNLARHAGIDARPMEILEDTGKGLKKRHIKICVVLPNNGHMFLDLKDGVTFKEHRKWTFISKSDLMALDYNNRYYYNLSDNEKRLKEGKESYIERAYDISPRHFRILNNLAAYSLEVLNDMERAWTLLLAAKEENPFFADTYYGLRSLSHSMGLQGEASKYNKRYTELCPE